MLLAGFAVVWLAYGVGLPGWGLLRGWDITLGQYWSPFHSYGSDPGQKWPPPQIPPDRVFPGPATPGVSGDQSVKAIQRATRKVLQRRGGTHGGVQ